jgi:type IV secretory pathway VirB10-like protein
MGLVLILLGTAAAGIVADFVIENDLASAPNQAFDLFGSTFNFSVPEVVLGAAVLGAVAITLIALGLGFLGISIGRRRERRAEVRELERNTTELQRRNQELARENAELRERTARGIVTAPAATTPPPPPPPATATPPPAVDRDRDKMDDGEEAARRMGF